MLWTVKVYFFDELKSNGLTGAIKQRAAPLTGLEKWKLRNQSVSQYSWVFNLVRR